MNRQISHRFKCIFVHIPKTAGTSLEMSPIFQKAKKKKGSHPAGHTSALEFKALFPEEFETYFKFTFVRNPWDRIVSTYFHFRQSDKLYDKEVFDKYLKKYDTFHEFCNNFINKQSIQKIIHLRPQYNFISNENGEIIIDYVGKYENLRNDFEYICNKIGAPLKLNHIRKTRHRHYSTYYNDETKEIVNKVFKKDIELFGYEFTSERFRNSSYYLNYLPDETKKILKKILRIKK